jgi:pyridoxal phosphate enzyme (YggS family)
MDLEENFTIIKQQIYLAEKTFHRAADSVSLLAVSKQQSILKIQKLIQCGQKDFGENYLQEAIPKIKALVENSITWHFIGPIQTNKIKDIARYFHWVHTVSRLKEAQYLSSAREATPALNICLQVKLDNNPNKNGACIEEVPQLIDAIKQLPNLSLRGLMALPPPAQDFEEQCRYFKIVRELFEILNDKGAKLDTLSMGMTQDLDAAIAEGSTMVRVGTGLFGSRKG